MATRKVIAICQSGGEFLGSSDGSLTYNGGDAYAIDIDEHTQLQDFKQEIAEMFNCSSHSISSIKYFLPGNRRTLITISKDKDLERMINFVGNAVSADVFIFIDEGSARNVPNIPASRSSRTTASEVVLHDPIDGIIDVPRPSDLVDMDIFNETPLSDIHAYFNDECCIVLNAKSDS